MTLVRFAGDSVEKHSLSEQAYFNRCKRAYELFKLGWDTVKIAKVMATKEHRVERYVTVGRCRARNLPIPYEGVE